jgi:non-heme chloroperoxidase
VSRILNVGVPPYVCQALLSRSIDNDDLLPKIRKPVLIAQSARDPVMKPAVIDQQMACIPGAKIRMMDRAGHACFCDDATAYNRCLQDFAEALQ